MKTFVTNEKSDTVQVKSEEDNKPSVLLPSNAQNNAATHGYFDSNDRMVRYDRGRAYLSTLEREHAEHRPEVNPRRYPPALPALGKWDKSWSIAKQMSAEYGCLHEQLRANAKLAFAVDLLAEHMDDHIRTQLLDPGCGLTDKQVRSIANTAPPRMRFAIEQFRSGCRDPLSVKTDVFDTVAFAEITSRIARADGSIRASLLFLVGARTPETNQQVQSIGVVIAELRGLLEACVCVGSDDPVPKYGPAAIPATKRGRCNQLNVGLALLSKCVRDIPRLPTQLRPTTHERDACLDRVINLSEQIAGFR